MLKYSVPQPSEQGEARECWFLISLFGGGGGWGNKADQIKFSEIIKFPMERLRPWERRKLPAVS